MVRHLDRCTFYFFYCLCSHLALLDFSFNRKKKRFQSFPGIRKFQRHFGFVLKLSCEFLLYWMWSDSYYLIVTLTVYPVYLHYKFIKRRNRVFRFLNKLLRCLRKTKTLTSKAVHLSWAVLVSLVWKISMVSFFFGVILYHYGTSPSFHVPWLLLIVFYQSILPTYVQTQCVLVELFYIAEMITSLNQCLRNVIVDLETRQMFTQTLYFINSFRTLSKLNKLARAYRRTLNLLRILNGLSSVDVVAVMFLDCVTLIHLSYNSEDITTVSPQMLFALMFAGFLYDAVLVMICYQKVNNQLTLCRILCGMSSIKRNFEWDKKVLSFLFDALAPETNLMVQFKLFKGFFSASLALAALFNVVRFAGGWKRIK